MGLLWISFSRDGARLAGAQREGGIDQAEQRHDDDRPRFEHERGGIEAREPGAAEARFAVRPCNAAKPCRASPKPAAAATIPATAPSAPPLIDRPAASRKIGATSAAGTSVSERGARAGAGGGRKNHGALPRATD